MPRLFREYWPVLTLVLFGLFIFAPVLFFGKVFFGEEQIGFYYAISHYVQSSLLGGIPLLWNGAYYGGVSASLDQFVGAWYPLNLFLFSVLSLFAAHHTSIAIATIAGLLLTYWFGRVQGWHQVSSLALAVGYLSATTYGWLQIGTIAAHSFMILPGLLLALWYASQKKKYILALVLGGVALGVGFLAGFMQIVFYVYVLAGLYALYLDYINFKRGTSLLYSFPASIGYACMTLLGLLVGLKQFLPSAALIDLTIRTNTYAIQNAVFPYPSEFITYLLPPYLYVPFFNGGGTGGFYIGVLGIVFAVLGLLYYRTPLSIFFAGAYAFIAAFAFHLPIFGWLNEHVPPFSHMGGNFRWIYAAALPLAFLGAVGIEGYLRDPERISARVRRGVLWCVGGVAAVLTLGSLALSYLSGAVSRSSVWLERLIAWYADGRALLLPQEHYVAVLRRAIDDFSTAFSLSNGKFLFGVSTWVVALLFFAALWYWRPLKRFLPYVIAGLMLANIGGGIMFEWTTLVPQTLYAKKPELVSVLQAREQNQHTYRILGFLLGDGMYSFVSSKRALTPSETTALHRDLLTSNTNLYWGIERMDGMEPYRMLRHNRLLNTVLGYDAVAYAFDQESPNMQSSPLDKLYNRDVQRAVSLSEKLEDFASRVPLLAMMNVTYVYSPYALRAPALALVQKIEVPAGGQETMDLYVYENTHVLPRVYFASNPKFIADTDTTVLIRVVETKDFSKESWIECASCKGEPLRGKSSVVVDRYENGRVEVTTSSTAQAWLVFSESFMPGWKATVDGVETPIYPANYLFQAIEVPPGEHKIVFAYTEATMVQLGALLK